MTLDSKQNTSDNVSGTDINGRIEDFIDRTTKASRKRIALSFLVLVSLLVVIASALTDYLGFARGWSFISRIVSEESISVTSASVKEALDLTSPIFEELYSLKRQRDIISSRIELDETYIETLRQALKKVKNDDSANNAFQMLSDQIYRQIGAIEHGDNCIGTTAVNVVDHLVSYSTVRADGLTPTSLSLRFCRYKGPSSDQNASDSKAERRYEFSNIAENDLDRSALASIHEKEELLSGLSSEVVTKAAKEILSLLKEEFDDLNTTFKELDPKIENTNNRIESILQRYLSANKVDIGQDVSFILSRIILIMSLMFLAAACLRIILNEIRFVNRFSELRVASLYSMLHENGKSFEAIARSVIDEEGISKKDADLQIGIKELESLVRAIKGRKK